MENLMETEYVINGEKYLITVTKVEEKKSDYSEEDFNCEECPCKDVCDAGMEIPNLKDFEKINVENEDWIKLPINLIPSGMDLETWLTIIKEYGVVLTD